MVITADMILTVISILSSAAALCVGLWPSKTTLKGVKMIADVTVADTNELVKQSRISILATAIKDESLPIEMRLDAYHQYQEIDGPDYINYDKVIMAGK